MKYIKSFVALFLACLTVLSVSGGSDDDKSKALHWRNARGNIFGDAKLASVLRSEFFVITFI
jgi:hypothetical protein